MMKRILSFVMSIVMLLSALPLQAMAADISLVETAAPVETVAVQETTVPATTVPEEPTESACETEAVVPEDTAAPVEPEPTGAETEATEEIVAVELVESASQEAAYSGTVTVHYNNTNSWTTVNGYVWESAESNNTWPGSKLEENREHPGWYDLTVVDDDGAFWCIFNNGISQTEDISVDYADGTTEFWYENGKLYAQETESWTPEEKVPAPASGTCGENAAWNISEDGVLTISGTGEMDGYSTDAPAPWAEQKDVIVEILVEEGITGIGSRAFVSFENLETVTIPDSVVNIGAYAFYGADVLQTIELPENLCGIGMAAFYSCDLLEAVHFPKTVETIADGCFGRCPALAEVTFEESRTAALTIAKDAFCECTALESVILPEGLTTLGGNVFYGCTALASVRMPLTLTSLQTNSFQACDALELEVQEHSISKNYAEDCAIPYSLYVVEDTTGIMLAESCGLAVNTERIEKDNLMDVTFRFGMTEESLSTLTAPVLQIYHSDNQTLQETTLTYNGQLCTDYRYTVGDCLLEIDLTQTEGTIGFCAEPDNMAEFTYWAYLCYTDGEITRRVEITRETSEVNILTMDMLGSTNDTQITVSGFAPYLAEVRIYLDGTYVGSTTADAYGTYAMEVSLGAPAESTGYVLKAVCTGSNGEELTAKKSVYYRHNGPEVGEIRFYHDSEGEDYIVLSGSDEPVNVDYVSSDNPYKFVVEISNPEAVGHVYVTSTVNNVKKTIDAVYDEESGTFIAVGYFDENDKFYKPNAVSVEYTLKSNAPAVGEEVDWEQMSGYLDDDLRNATVNNTTEGENSYGTVDLSGTIEGLQGVMMKYMLTTYDDANGTDLSSIRSYYKTGENILGYIIPGLDDSRYYAYLDFSDPNTYKVLIDDGLDVGGKAIELEMLFLDELSGGYKSLEAISEVLSSAGVVATVLGDAYAIHQDMNEIRNEIAVSDMESTEKKKAYEDVDKLEADKQLFTLAVTMLPIMVTAGMAATPAVAMFTGIISVMSVASNVVYDHRVAGITGGTADTNWYPTVYTKTNSKQIGDNLYSDAHYICLDYFEGFGFYAQIDYIEISIRGHGAMWPSPNIDCYDNDSLNRYITKIDIPQGVTTIGSGAFGECSELTKIDLPSSVEVIGSYAFSGCRKLEEINIPSSVTEINDGAFYECTSLTQVDLPDSVERIGKEVFAYCKNLSSLSLGEGLLELGTNAFYGCEKLESLELPGSLEKVGCCVFLDCPVAIITIPQNVTDVPECTEGHSISGDHSGCGFLADSSIQTVYFEEGTKKIADRILSNADTVETVYLPDTVAEIGDFAFYNCDGLTGVTIPSNVLEIGDSAFEGCNLLANVTMSASVEKIGNEAFSSCENLKEIQLPDTLKTIGSAAFCGTAIKQLYIPQNVETLLYDWSVYWLEIIGRGPFYGMKSLQNIYVDIENPFFTSVDGVMFDKLQKTLVAYPSARKGDYTIPYGVETIAKDAFSEMEDLNNSIFIPATVNTIEDYAFYSYNGWASEAEGSYVAKLYFEGNAPWISGSAFQYADVEIYYPKGFWDWEETSRYTLGADVISWHEYFPENLKVVEKAVKSIEEFEAALELTQYYPQVNITLNFHFTPAKDYVIPENMKLELSSSSYGLTIPDGVTLTNCGSIDVSDWAELTVAAGGTLLNQGTLNLARYAEFLVEGICTGNDPIYESDGCASSFKDLKQEIAAGEDYVWIDGDIVLEEDLSVPQTLYLSLDESSTLTVPKGTKLVVEGTMAVRGGTVTAAGSIVNNGYIFAEAGTLDASAGSYTAGDNAYFYMVGGACTVRGVDPAGIHLSCFAANEEILRGALALSSYRHVAVYLMESTDLTANLTVPKDIQLVVGSQYGGAAETITLRIPSGITLTNNGTVAVQADGCFHIQENGTFVNNGIFSSSGSYIQEGTVIGEGESYIEKRVSSLDELKAALSTDPVPDAVVLLSDITLTEDLTVPENVELQANAAITVPEGMTLEVSGTLYMSGLLDVQSGATLICDGMIHVRSGTLNVDGDYTLNGSILQEEGATVRNIPTSDLAYHVQVSGEDELRAALELIGDHYHNGYVMADFDCRLTTISGEITISENVQLIIGYAGDTMVLTSGAVMQNYGEIVVYSKLLVESGATLHNFGDIDTSYGTVVNRGTVTGFDIQGIEITASEDALVAGRSMTLTAEGTEANLIWTVTEGGDYVTLKPSSTKATVTAGSVTEAHKITVQASTENPDDIPGTISFYILPKVESVVIMDESGAAVSGATVLWDLNDNSHGTLTFQASVLPGDAIGDVVWSVNDTEGNYGAYSYGPNSITVTPGDKTGTVILTATAADNSKKSASVTIRTVRVPCNLEKADEVEGDADIAILGGKSRNLVVMDKDTNKALTAKQITWSVAPEFAAYASVTAKGKLTTKKVLEKVRVEVVGTMVDNPGVTVVYYVDIYPAVSYVEILNEGGTVVNGQTLKLNTEGENPSMDLDAVVSPNDALEGVTWKSSSTKVATVDENGVVRPVLSKGVYKSGTVTITATAKDGSKKKAAVKIQVGPVVNSVTIAEPASTVLRSGKTLTLKATTDPVKPGVTGVTWEITDGGEYATISASGKLKANTVFEARRVTVVAVSKDAAKVRSEPITITILPKADETLALKHGSLDVTGQTLALDSLNQGETVTLSAWLTSIADGASADTGAKNVAWTTSDASVASLSAAEGESVTVTLLKAGKTTVTATAVVNGKTVTAKVTVKGAALVNSLTVTAKEAANVTETGIEVASGKAVTLVAKANDEAASKKVTWSITKGGAYAAVTASGKLTAAKDLTSAQPVTVRATAADGSGKTAEVTVTVRPIAQGVQVYTIENGVQTFAVRSSDSIWVRNSTTAQWDITTQGSIVLLDADVYPFYGADDTRNAMQSVTWKSSAPKVADFVREDNGDLALAEGRIQLNVKQPGKTTVTVTAADGSKKKVSFTLNVVKNVDDLELEPQVLASGKSLNLAKLVKLVPTGTTTKKLSWAITGGDGAAYATLSASGTLKAKTVTGHKQVIVTATAQDSGGYSEDFTIDLYPATKKVTLFRETEEVTGKTLNVSAGDTFRLTAQPQPGTAAKAFTFSSSKPNLVSVDAEGTVTVLGESGTAVITCTATDGTKKKATVTLRIG